MRPYALLMLLLALSPVSLGGNASVDPKETVVAILMFDGVEVIDYAAPYEVFVQAGFSIYTVSKDGRGVRASGGLKSEVNHSFASAPPATIVVVPGGHVEDVQKDEATLEWLRKQATSAGHVMSVCTGSFILGRSGLLDDKSATTFHRAFDAMQAQFPKVKIVRDQRWVDSGKIVTSAGLASGIDTSLHVLSEVRGLKEARSVAMMLEYDWHPDSGFVRGKFADRNLRFPSTMRPPEGTKIDMVTSIGDERSWELEYLVDSPLDANKLFDELANQAKQDPAFAVKPRTRPDQLAWDYDSPYGGRWNASFVAKPTDRPDRYWITATLSPVR